MIIKIRSSFITNSSSSSFVIAVKNNTNELAHKLFKGLMSRYDKLLTTKEDAWEKYSDGWYKSEEHLKRENKSYYKQYQKTLKLLNDDFTIYCFSIEYADDTHYKMIKLITDDKNIVVLESGD